MLGFADKKQYLSIKGEREVVRLMRKVLEKAMPAAGYAYAINK